MEDAPVCNELLRRIAHATNLLHVSPPPYAGVPAFFCCSEGRGVCTNPPLALSLGSPQANSSELFPTGLPAASSSSSSSSS
eukprot:CAMPEP_0181245644 /NCGR_PEP_ID=MMETSP1096-20121128/43551_1 /TAXON_ID=156174 ORGANISM="Chrysochromulina ericina, Strain CCMP281" /NCGR_SAMPLE_ID=MMETSP1096 /ASSEMBLY_ACC=CAM_ASM_000453 /LENGTH=80 /DNA_ID=CAMNT_0023342369 /DNA_START=1105 /DNA_END=1345 /DNA_ORIENTATION=+